MQTVTFVLVRHGFGELVARLGLARFGAPAPASVDPASIGRDRLGKRIAKVLADLGPTYVKLGQLLATREDLLPPEITAALRELHAAVPPLKAKVVERVIFEALGQTPEQAFAWFDRTPLAAASIGQVHRARLKTGEEVVVKVQRPDLHRMVAGDLALMRLLAKLLAQAVPEVATYDPLALLDAFERSIEAELDFRREAENALRLAQLLHGAAEVRVPGVHAAYKTVLVLEFVRGQKMGSLEAPAKKRARASLVRAFVRQVLDFGVFHGDPHPGNILVEESGRVVLLDLGAVERIDAGLRMRLLRVVLAMALRRKRALGAAVVDVAMHDPNVTIDRPRLEIELAQLVADTSSGANGAQLVGQMVAISRAHSLRMPPALLGLSRSLAILDGVLRSLDPAADLVADVRREMVPAIARAVWRSALAAVAWTLATLARGARKLSGVAARASAAAQPRAGRPSLTE
jgi:ubiquinone biosynthesis protein